MNETVRKKQQHPVQ